MSEVKRYTMVGSDWESASDATGKWVRASDYDAAQSELAALREELAETQRISQQEELRANEYATQLVAAELRNADCIALLRRSSSGEGQDPYTWWNDRALILQAALQPTESGASE